MSHVWYVSYGSNMSAARLTAYLEGGRPPGGSRAHPGARDGTPPARSIPVDLPGSLYFAGESPQWGGGVAYYDHDTPGFTAARGRYETLVEVGRHGGVPLLTFTAPHGVDHVEHARPSPTYLRTIGLGLRESRGCDQDEVAED